MSTRRYKGKYYSPKRRKVYAQGDDIDPVTLFDKHDWVCYGCGEEIDRRKRFPSVMAATIEHIVPISKGGTHTWDNVRPAHAICNFRKGDSTEGLDTASGLC